MKRMTSEEIINTYIDFFVSHGHLQVKSSSLIPKNDPSVLWVNAGVTPLKKYFDGTEVPKNRRLTSCQKCIRTNDIENVEYYIERLQCYLYKWSDWWIEINWRKFPMDKQFQVHVFETES